MRVYKYFLIFCYELFQESLTPPFVAVGIYKYSNVFFGINLIIFFYKKLICR